MLRSPVSHRNNSAVREGITTVGVKSPLLRRSFKLLSLNSVAAGSSCLPSRFAQLLCREGASLRSTAILLLLEKIKARKVRLKLGSGVLLFIFCNAAFVLVIRKAGLASFLNVSGFLTVFAPTDDAFDSPEDFLERPQCRNYVRLGAVLDSGSCCRTSEKRAAEDQTCEKSARPTPIQAPSVAFPEAPSTALPEGAFGSWPSRGGPSSAESIGTCSPRVAVGRSWQLTVKRRAIQCRAWRVHVWRPERIPVSSRLIQRASQRCCPERHSWHPSGRDA